MKLLSIYKLMTDNAIAVNTTTNTSQIKTDLSTGYASLYVSNSAGSLKIIQQVSQDGITFIDPVDEGNNSLAIVASGIVKGTTSIVQFNPVLAPYTRYAIIEGNSNATTVALTLMMQEER